MVFVRMSQAQIMQSPPGPETVVDGVRYLYFGGTDYLGLASHPEVIEAGCRALRDFGVHSATSRSGIGTNEPVQQVERRAAQFFGTEDAFYFTSGYVANHIMVGTLAPDADALLLDEAAHYSVQEAARLAKLPVTVFRSGDPDDLAKNARAWRRVLVLANAVGPATGNLAPVCEHIRVLEEHESATILLDDAHGFGVLGESGRGLLDHVNLWQNANNPNASDRVRLAVCGTLAKAFGGFGGIIPGTSSFVARARSGSHYYDGASAPPSAAAGATARAIEIVMGDPSLRQRLRRNVIRVRQGLRKLGLNVPEEPTAHLGLTIGNSDRMRRIHGRLKERGILLPYLEAYSGIASEGVLRLAVFASHTEEQLDHLIAELGRVL